MPVIKNTPRITDPVTRRARAFIAHRAQWFYLLLDEARKHNLDWETFAPGAVYRCGLIHGAAHASAAGGPTASLKALRKRLFGLLPRRIFEVTLRESTDDTLAVDFHYCPLVEAWVKLGATEEEIGKLCDYAMAGDAGIAREFGAELVLGGVIAKGSEVCEVRFERKKGI